MQASFKILDESDDERDATAALPDAGAAGPGGAGDKKKRRKPKKKPSTGAEASVAAPTAGTLSSTGVLEDIVAKAAKLGFKRPAVEAAINAMWDENGAYDNADAVIARLQGKNGKSAPAATAAPKETASKPPVAPAAKVAEAASAPVPAQTAGRQPGKKQASPQVAPSPAPAAPAPVASASTASVTVADKTKTEAAATPAPSLQKTLEDSCKLPNLPSVLESLTVWAHRASESDVDVLCTSQALPLLFANLLTKAWSRDVENRLRGFLETLLAKDAAPTSAVIPVVKSAVSGTCAQCRAAVSQFAELATSDDSAAVNAALTAFSKRFAANLLSFRVVVARQLRAPETSRLSSRTVEPKASPKILTALEASSDPGALFRARDVLRQQTRALFATFSTVHGVFAEGGGDDSDAAKLAAVNVSDDQLQAAFSGLLPTSDADAKSKAAAVRDQLVKLRTDQAALLAPIVDSTVKIDAEAGKLRGRRQELIKELEGIDEQLRGLVEQKSTLQKSAQEVDARFREQIAALDAENKGCAALVAKMEAVPALQSSLTTLAEELDSCKSALRASTRAATSAAAVISTRAEYSDASLTYLKVEKKCIEFLRQRIAATQTDLDKLKFEIARYEELGMARVVKECASTATKYANNIAEDTAALSALCCEAVGVINSFRTATMNDDDDSVQLHPAEIVLQHRMRSIAASTGVLLPLSADLSKQDFTKVATVNEDKLWPLPAEPSADEDALMPAMLATIGIAPESLAPLNAEAAAAVADANPSSAPVKGPKAGKKEQTAAGAPAATASAPAPAPAAAAPKPAAVAKPASPARASVPAVSSTPAKSTGTKAAWGAKPVAAVTSLKNIIQEETRGPVAAAGTTGGASASVGAASSDSQSTGAEAPVVESPAQPSEDVEEGEIIEEDKADVSASGETALPQRGRKARVRADN